MADPTTPVVATENVIVHDDLLNIDRRIFAGQPVPPDLLEAYNAKVGGGSKKKATAKSKSEPEGYDAQSVEDLEKEATKRELQVEGTGKDGNVVKADYVKALEANDAENA